MPKQLCQVSVTVDGRKWTMEVEAASLYAAVFAYHSDQRTGHSRHYPPLTPDLPIEVRLADGREFVTTWRKAMAWANRQRS